MRLRLLFLLLCMVVFPPFASHTWADDPFTEFRVKPAAIDELPDATLPAIDGTATGLRDYGGTAALVSFWAPWCAPCIAEFPQLERLWQRHREKGFAIVAITIDAGSPEKIGKLTARLGVTMPVLLDTDGALKEKFAISGLPTTFLVEKQKVIGVIVGARNWDSGKADKLVERLLAGSAGLRQGVTHRKAAKPEFNGLLLKPFAHGHPEHVAAEDHLDVSVKTPSQSVPGGISKNRLHLLM